MVMPFDIVQKIIMGIIISDVVIASALLTVLWVKWRVPCPERESKGRK
jgi:hypothetical protein